MDKDNRIKELQGRIDQLELEIDQLELEKELAEKWLDNIKALSNFSDADKAEIFDALYGQCARYLKTLAETGWPPKDGEEYLFEFVMEKCLGTGVWSVIRAIQN